MIGVVDQVIGIAKNTLSNLSNDGDNDDEIIVVTTPRSLDLEKIVKNSIGIVQNSLNQIEPKPKIKKKNNSKK